MIQIYLVDGLTNGLTKVFHEALADLKNKLASFFSPRKALIQRETKDACQYDAYIRSKSMKTLNSTWSCESLQISRDVSNSGYFPRALRYFKKCLKQLESRDILSKNIIVRALATFKL